METNTLKVYEILKSQWGKDKASTVIDYLESSISEKVDNKAEHLTTKEDLLQVEKHLEIQIQKVKSEIIKWMFIFWVGTIGIMIAIIKLL